MQLTEEGEGSSGEAAAVADSRRAGPWRAETASSTKAEKRKLPPSTEERLSRRDEATAEEEDSGQGTSDAEPDGNKEVRTEKREERNTSTSKTTWQKAVREAAVADESASGAVSAEVAADSVEDSEVAAEDSVEHLEVAAPLEVVDVVAVGPVEQALPETLVERAPLK